MDKRSIKRFLRKSIKPYKLFVQSIYFYICRLFPLQDKVIATTFKGMKYGDNPQYILEELRKINGKLDFIWLKQRGYNYEVPSWIRIVPYELKFKTIYEISTAKVIIDSHRFKSSIRKRKGQLFIETWHGGVAIKKLETDVPKFCVDKTLISEIKTSNKLVDVYISQSDLLSSIYRRAFKYEGPIFKCGYPKNDILFTDRNEKRKDIRRTYGLEENEQIMLYAPSFRDSFYETIDVSFYNVDFDKLHESLCYRFGGKWTIMVRWHPLFASHIAHEMNIPDYVIDATSYPDMQELMMASDALLSDYSSCLFDAALIDIPCFIFATDFEAYKADRGVYFELDELPFPHSCDNEGLAKIVASFDEKEYKENVTRFFDQIGLVETGHAGKDIAERIIQFIDGKTVGWDN